MWVIQNLRVLLNYLVYVMKIVLKYYVRKRINLKDCKILCVDETPVLIIRIENLLSYCKFTDFPIDNV